MARYSGFCADERRHALYIRDSYTCCYCGTVLAPGSAHLSLDHLKTWAAMEREGGRLDHSNTNLVTSCKSCNCSRQDRPLADFAPGGALQRIAIQISRPVDMAAGKAAWQADRARRGYGVTSAEKAS